MYFVTRFMLAIVFGYVVAAAGPTTTQLPDVVDMGGSEDSPMQSLMPYIQVIRTMFQSGMLQALVNNGVDSALTAANISNPCLTDVEQIINDVFSKKDYALQFLDADAKIPPGILQGHWAWFGDYEQCKAIESPYNESTRHVFRGQYCNVMLYRNGQPFFPNGLPLTIGVCLPDSCAKADVHAIASSVVSPLSEFNISVPFVEMDEVYPYSTGAIICLIICALLLLLVIVGTLVDVLYIPLKADTKTISGVDNGGFRIEVGAEPEKAGAPGPATNGVTTIGPINKADGVVKTLPPTEFIGMVTTSRGHLNDVAADCGSSTAKPFIVKCLISFSFITNTTKLLNTSTANGPLACLNGLRVISLWWVIQGHTYGVGMTVLDNAAYASKTLMTRFSFQVIANATFSVDTFFFLSGLLVAYLALKEWKKRGKMNWVYYFVHRYWRLTPVYAFVLFFYVTLVFKHMLHGPLKWLGSSPNGLGYPILTTCESYWWTNLLYFNNLYPHNGATNVCMGWSWYLANDMQFYVLISPILLILFYKTRVIGWVVSSFLIIACVIIRGVLVSHYGIIKVDGSSTKHQEDPWGRDSLYHYPWTRMSVYVVGMVTGYILYVNKCKIRLNRLISLIGWVISIATALSLVYGLYDHYKYDGEKMSLTESWFYNAFDRTAWALCLAWVTIACVSGYGGWVNTILSWKIWAPLGRLTYTAYLVHSIVMIIFDFSATASTHFTDLSSVSSFVAFLAMSYACAYVVSMIAEAPMMQLEKCILGRDR